MKVRLIIAQYPVRYAGELAPNVVDAWDEYTLEDNYEGYEQSLRSHEAMVGKEYEAVVVLNVNVPDAAIDALFQVAEVDAEVQT